MKQLFFLMLCLASIAANAQNIDVNDLYGLWQLDKYSDAEQYYQVPKKEIGDYIQLNEKMTFIVVSEGEKATGTWLFNTNGKYIEFRYEDGEKEKVFVHFLSNKSMVITYDEDEYRLWEAHFVKKQEKTKDD